MTNRNVAPKPIERRWWLGLGALCLASLAGHALAYGALPEVVPMHWGAAGQVDGWAAKQMTILLDLLPLALLGLQWLVPRIDPKGHSYEHFGGVYKGFVVALTVFLVALTWLTEATCFGLVPAKGAVNLIVGGAVGLLLLVMGNYLPKVKQNYSFGVKTPWALNDPENWRRTQRFGGMAMVVMGVATIALALLGAALPAGWVIGGLVAVIAGGTAVVYLYSYLLWKRQLG